MKPTPAPGEQQKYERTNTEPGSDKSGQQVRKLGLTWAHLDSLGLTWTHLDSLRLTWTHLDSLGLTCTHQNSLELSRSHQDSLEPHKTRKKYHPAPKGKRERWRDANDFPQFPPHYQTPHVCVRATEPKRFPGWAHSPNLR